MSNVSTAYVLIIVSVVVTWGREWEITPKFQPLRKKIVRKFSSKNTKFGAENPPFCANLWAKFEILSTPVSSVGNLQLSVGKLQLPAPPPTLTHYAAAACAMRVVVVDDMRVDLSPRLGGHTEANQPSPHYCPPLIHLHPPGTLYGLTADVEQSHELNLNLRFTLL